MDHPMAQPLRGAKPVIIAGAGPTGLMLAYELRRGGVGVLLGDRRGGRRVGGCPAAGTRTRPPEIFPHRRGADPAFSRGHPSRPTHLEVLTAASVRDPS